MENKILYICPSLEPTQYNLLSCIEISFMCMLNVQQASVFMGYDYYVKVIGRILVGLFFFLQFASFLLSLDQQKKRLENHKAYFPIRWLQMILYGVIGLFFVIDFYAQYTAAFAIGLISFEVLMIDFQGEPLTLYPNYYRFQALLSKVVLIAACLMIIAR